MHINGDELIKQVSVTKNSTKVSGIKTTHGSQMLSNIKSKYKI